MAPENRSAADGLPGRDGRDTRVIIRQSVTIAMLWMMMWSNAGYDTIEGSLP